MSSDLDQILESLDKIVGSAPLDLRERLEQLQVALRAGASETSATGPAPVAARIETANDVYNAQRIVQYVTNLEVLNRAEDVGRKFSLESDGDDVKTPPRPRSGDAIADLMQIAQALRDRIGFVRDAVLGGPLDLGSETMISRLQRDLGMLNSEEAALARDLLEGDSQKMASWSERERDRFLDSAWPFARRFPARSFDRYVRRQFLDNGWAVADFKQARTHRADFLVLRGRVCARVAARVVDPPRPYFESAIRNLAKRSSASVTPASSVLIIPDYLMKPGVHERPDGSPVIVLRLRTALNKPELLSVERPP